MQVGTHMETITGL